MDNRLLARLPARTRKIVVAIVGGTVLIVGAVMIPYPGPGWLVVFMGLAILSREFAWAKRALSYGRAKYDYWSLWIVRQHPGIKALLFVFTCAVVIVTIWLLNGYGLLNAWFNLDQDWLNSPFIK